MILREKRKESERKVTDLTDSVFAERKTVGHDALNALVKMQKNPDTLNPIELTNEMLKGYMDYLREFVTQESNKFIGSFYIVVLLSKEKHLANIYKKHWISRETCPSPGYDQEVWFYDKKTQEVEFLWALPDLESCMCMSLNRNLVVHSEMETLGFIIAFENGELMNYAKFRNGEFETPVIS